MTARAFLLVGGLVLGAPAVASGSVAIGAREIVVSTPGARAVIDRAPFRLRVQDGAGRTVLSEVPGGGASTLVEPPVVQSQTGAPSPAGPALYAPLSFLVGFRRDTQFTAGQFEGNLISSQEGGIQYAARGVVAAGPVGSGVRLTLSTSDPTGRTLAVAVAPSGSGAIRVSARPSAPAGVAVMADSFSSSPGEAFHGFGGRHNALDQRGNTFPNFLQQENVSSGSASGLSAANPGTGGDRYLFPNGPLAAYYVQSSFISNAGYGFLLDRSELSEWRMASERPDAWRTATAGPGLDYVVAPGGAHHAIGTLTRLTGRQPAPPSWALGPILDRLVRYPSDPAPAYAKEVEGDLRDIPRYHLPLSAYRIEGWQFLPKPVLARYIRTLKRRHIHPMVYFRSFVGRDTIGTDDPRAYDEAIAKGYVATTADGRPYTFVSNFNAPAAQIDFTNPAAVRWWQGRVRHALDLGADGFMQDFGEQVLLDMHFHDGSTGATMHNRLPVLYHRATMRAVRAYERRHRRRHIFYFTRAGYSGSPGSAAYEEGNFPGDETTDFSRSAGLASQTTDMLNRAVGGAYGFTTDIGGFFDLGPFSPTSKELFVRWAEWAALSPLFRLHGSVGAGTHTPWSYDAQTVRIYKALSRLHQRAAPLILKLWRRADRTGIPITRPLWLQFPRDARAAREDQEWMLGPDVLVAPVVDPGVKGRTVYLPRGCWRRNGRGRKLRGGRALRAGAPLASLPWYVHCGKRPFPAAGAARR